MTTLTTLKTRLARVDERSWHYRVARWAWGRQLQAKTHKACFYWWIRVPLSLLIAGIKALGYAFIFVAGGVAAVVIGAVVIVATWMAGFTIGFITDKRTGQSNFDFFYDYKYSPRKGKQHRYAPYQFVLPVIGVAAIGLAVRLGLTHPVGGLQALQTGGYVALVFAALMLLGLVVRWSRGNLKALWDKACPAVTFVPQASDQRDAA